MESEAAVSTAPAAAYALRKGEAAIKKEFVRPVPTRESRVAAAAAATAAATAAAAQNGSGEAVTADGVTKTATETGVESAAVAGDTTAQAAVAGEKRAAEGIPSEEAPRAKRKRGMNKSRKPTFNRPPMAERLCSLVARGETCTYGEKCRFSHDVAAFVATKRRDLDGECVLFMEMGRCPYGLMCRFAGNHTSADNENVVNEEVARAYQPSTINVLSKQLQTVLRQRHYDFTRSDTLVEDLDRAAAAGTGGRTDPTNKTANGSDAASGVAAVAAAAEGSTSTDVADSSAQNSGMSLPEPAEATAVAAVEVKAEKAVKTLGAVTDIGEIKLRPQEKKTIDFSDKLYLAPLTTVGNLPFRRICKRLGADITCGEMSLATQLLQGQTSEWALVKRHECEDLFGVQIAGSFPDSMTRCAQLLQEQCDLDFIDINVGCPIDLIFKKGAGCALMARQTRFERVVRSVSSVMNIPLTVKMRTGVYDRNWNAHELVPKLYDWGASLVTVHGRSREQRYTRQADWTYLSTCASAAEGRYFYGNGDILSYEDFESHRQITGLSGVMLARGALIKPWLFTEIKEKRHWDISSSERFDMMRDFSKFGLSHWGSDSKGIETTRRFLLEWLSFLHRYIPVGVLEVLPQRINERPVPYFGRDDMETMLASDNCQDWVKLSEMLLGPVADDFSFLPKHRANSYPSTTTRSDPTTA